MISDTRVIKSSKKFNMMEEFRNQNMFSDISVWDEEYSSIRAIPSSTRLLPSKGLLQFSEIVDFNNQKRVLDMGTGIGRNAIFIANKGSFVTALDGSKVALSTLRKLVEENRLAKSVNIVDYVFQTSLPFEKESFDVIIDSYFFCHLINEVIRENYLNELNRILNNEGLIYMSVFAEDDEYYDKIREANTERDSGIVEDPHNHVRKQLYTSDQIQAILSNTFTIKKFKNFKFDDVVLGQTFKRSLYITLLSKRK